MRIFSGIQPTGTKHLGNYIGAITQYVAGQDRGEAIYCIVDLHALTVAYDPADLRAGLYDLLAVLLAAGLDPERCVLFRQSDVREHTELTWLLSSVTSYGELTRMTQFKDKAGSDRENASAGLYVYPNLMAADILAYHATRVPVGDDQRQHLELANDIAQKFNHDYEVDFFPRIEPLIPGTVARVMSLRDGTKKMSKSDPSDQSRINLTDSADEIAQKIKRAKTDPEPLPESVDGLAERPEARNLVEIYAALAGSSAPAVLKDFAGQGFGKFKPALAELVIAKLRPIAAETEHLLADPATLDGILRDGAERAATIADPIVSEAERLVGLLKV